MQPYQLPTSASANDKDVLICSGDGKVPELIQVGSVDGEAERRIPVNNSCRSGPETYSAKLFRQT
jgi:hypothetical protein